MTLDEITIVDPRGPTARYGTAITAECGALARFLGATLEVMLAWSRVARLTQTTGPLGKCFTGESESMKHASTTTDDESVLNGMGVKVFHQMEAGLRGREKHKR